MNYLFSPILEISFFISQTKFPLNVIFCVLSKQDIFFVSGTTSFLPTIKIYDEINCYSLICIIKTFTHF